MKNVNFVSENFMWEIFINRMEANLGKCHYEDYVINFMASRHIDEQGPCCSDGELLSIIGLLYQDYNYDENTLYKLIYITCFEYVNELEKKIAQYNK